MASEIRVDKINSLSGVGTVTLSPTGVDIAGITTAATLRATTGIVTSLTAVSSAKVGSGITLSPDGDIFATGITTVNNQVHIPDYIHHVGDNDCKFGFESGDTFAVETGSTERLRIDSSGRLLLGTTTEGYSSADDLTVATSGHTGITIRSGTGNLGTLAFSDGTSGTAEYDGYIQYSQDQNYMDFATNAGNVRMRINSSGHVNIGSADPRKVLDITGPDGRSGASPGNSDTALVIDNDGGNGAIIEMLADNNAYGRIFFTDTDASNQGGIIYKHGDDSLNFQTNASERVSISSGGNLTISDGDLVIGTSGHGISFAATSDGASGAYFSELLDDYEEGTFTPTWSGSSVTFAYSQQHGWYTKIGDTVTFHIYLQGYAASIISGNSGNPLSVEGLPFSCKSVNRYYPPVTIGRTYRMDIDSDQRIYAYINQGSTEIKLILEQDDTTGSMMTVGRLDTNTCEILLSGHYKI